MKLHYFAIIFFLFNANLCLSQDFDLGSWNIINIKYQIEKKWSIFSEAQIRSLKLYSNYHYYEYKGGIDYKFNKNTKFTLGGGSYQTFMEGGDFVLPKNNNEIRIWPQITLFQTNGAFNIEQRYRSELRFTSNGYRNRFRYRFGLSFPFGEQVKNFKPFQISVSNELFFTNNEPYFERNRVQCAFNYKPLKSTTIQIGYLHQFDYKISDETGRDFLIIGFYYEIFRKLTSTQVFDNELKDN